MLGALCRARIGGREISGDDESLCTVSSTCLTRRPLPCFPRRQTFRTDTSSPQTGVPDTNRKPFVAWFASRSSGALRGRQGSAGGCAEVSTLPSADSVGCALGSRIGNPSPGDVKAPLRTLGHRKRSMVRTGTSRSSTSRGRRVHDRRGTFARTWSPPGAFRGVSSR